MNIVLFEDIGAQYLYPISTSRPCYAITCASYRLIDWVDQMEGVKVSIVRRYLDEISRLDFPQFQNEIDKSEPWTLALNARLVPSVSNFDILKKLIADSKAGQDAQSIRIGHSVGAAMIPTEKLADPTPEIVLRAIEENSAPVDESADPTDLRIFEYPHDVIRENMDVFDENIRHRIEHGGYQQVSDNLYVGKDVKLHDSVVVDPDSGPVVIDDGASVGPFCFFRGPVYVGPNSKINEHASLKDGVSLGHTSRMGGEIEGTIVEPLSNKQHHGFLGHSYLGSWINLGAGTCNSDLKNTYGKVNMEYRESKHETGMQFVGCVIGDYTKSAINTSIFTGKIIGVCSMLYGFVTSNSPSFTNYAKSFDQMSEMTPHVMQATQKRMFDRRKIEQRGCDIQLLNDMFDMTAHERDFPSQPLSF